MPLSYNKILYDRLSLSHSIIYTHKDTNGALLSESMDCTNIRLNLRAGLSYRPEHDNVLNIVSLSLLRQA